MTEDRRRLKLEPQFTAEYRHHVQRLLYERRLGQYALSDEQRDRLAEVRRALL